MEIKIRAKEIINQMTLEEKVEFLSGKDFWHAKGNEKYGLPEVMLTDGPHGLRKQDGESDNFGINDSVPSIAFPTSATTACSFDVNLMKEIGECLGEECVKEDVAVILGPGVNHKRSPLCGRNFEYFSEDPYLTGKMAAKLVEGIQEKGVGTSVKHFACNSQEKARMVGDSIIDERTLREIYLKSFEIVVKESQPYTIMPSYNKINGVYSCENNWLLNEVARKEWGFKGMFVTDWGAMSDPIKSFEHGLNLEMPGTYKGTQKLLIDAVNRGEITERVVDDAASKVIEMILKSQEKKGEFNLEKSIAVAEKASRESSVLLKNDGILPLNQNDKIAVIGTMAKKPRYQGAGSSKINPITLDSFVAALEENKVEYNYCEGYEDNGDTNEKLIEESLKIVKSVDKVIIFVGLPDSFESEGYDRASFSMPKGHIELVEKVSQANKNVVVVLQGGSPFMIPFVNDVSAILHTYLSGIRGGHATFDLLFGKYSPSGKLAESYPKRIEDTPCYSTYGKDKTDAIYKESIFTGYRYYTSANIETLFPFGYGLSYAKFQYLDMQIDKDLLEEDKVEVKVTIKNVGEIAGKEIVQLYVGGENSKIFRAKRELKGFVKVELQPNEQKTVTFNLCKNDFAFYNVLTHSWFVESGEYRIEVGASAVDIKFAKNIKVNSKDLGEIPDYRTSAKMYYDLPKENFDVPNEQFEKLLGHPIVKNKSVRPFTRDTAVGDLKESFFGRIILKQIAKNAEATLGSDEELKKMANAMMKEMPIRALGMVGGMDKEAVMGIVDIANGHPLKGTKKMKKK